jgi:hypothetical protein
MTVYGRQGIHFRLICLWENSAHNGGIENQAVLRMPRRAGLMHNCPFGISRSGVTVRILFLIAHQPIAHQRKWRRET